MHDIQQSLDLITAFLFSSWAMAKLIYAGALSTFGRSIKAHRRRKYVLWVQLLVASVESKIKIFRGCKGVNRYTPSQQSITRLLAFFFSWILLRLEQPAAIEFCFIFCLEGMNAYYVYSYTICV